MKTLYIECKMGIAGDMLCAALYELLSAEQQTLFLKTMNSIFQSDLRFVPQKTSQCGIRGTHMQVLINGIQEGTPTDSIHTNHHHHDYLSILSQIDDFPFSATVKEHIKEIYQLLGNAESQVHGQPLSQIHFHEIGSMDAIADICACCYLIDILQPAKILASPIHVGNGTVFCAHGILPVPAPATAILLNNIPFYTGEIPFELATPTGVAILKHFCTEFISMPIMQTSTIGIGFGTKELSQLNCVRAFWGNTSHEKKANSSNQIVELSCNIDDMTGEELGFLMDTLLVAGALDVYYAPIYMKKNRPGILLHCLCQVDKQETYISLIFKYSSTRGIRYQSIQRVAMDYQIIKKDTELGTIRQKISTGFGVTKSKYEYEDLKQIAIKQNTSIHDILEKLNAQN